MKSRAHFLFWQAKLHVYWPFMQFILNSWRSLCGDKKSGAVTHVTLAAKPREIGKANQIRSCECRKWSALDLPLCTRVHDAVEFGIGILLEEQLDNPPEGRTVRDIAMHSSRHARV